MIYFLTIGFMAVLLIGIPVAFSLGIAGLLGFISSSSSVAFSVIAQKMMTSLNNFILLAVPLFILAAKLMNTAGITKKIFSFADTCVGFMPGGLGHANAFASLIFAGMSGAAVADVAGLGQIELDAMADAGYDKGFSVAITAASSTIGPIFPPSIPMLVFALASGVSVGRLFLGGIVPGVLMTVSLMVMVWIYAVKRKYPRKPFPTLKLFAQSLYNALLPLLTPVILLGGIWTGFFTPTEAAAVAVFYAILIGTLVLKELNLKIIVDIFIDTAKETAIIGFIITTAAFCGWILMRTGITIRISQAFLSISANPLLVLYTINIFLLILGCFLDSTVSILILSPILVPVIEQLGIDPVHFGVVMVLNLMLGLLTPPFGVVLFVIQHISKLSFAKVVKETMPFLVPLFIVLFLTTTFPGIVLWLPNLLY
ncbi:MAG: TRAP transporter large permease [Spirochaetales bacterium]|jgi:tripartite ATP-independent transporter DctM subunit|nr:TRAP transporter large permease [Spirochaetales bacterium]